MNRCDKHYLQWPWVNVSESIICSVAPVGLVLCYLLMYRPPRWQGAWVILVHKALMGDRVVAVSQKIWVVLLLPAWGVGVIDISRYLMQVLLLHLLVLHSFLCFEGLRAILGVAPFVLSMEKTVGLLLLLILAPTPGFVVSVLTLIALQSLVMILLRGLPCELLRLAALYVENLLLLLPRFSLVLSFAVPYVTAAREMLDLSFTFFYTSTQVIV